MSEVNEPSNDEATELEKLILSGKPWLEQNGTLLIYALAAVLAVAAIIVYLNRRPSGNTSASRDLLLAVSPEEFRDVADSHPDSQIGIWARLRQADRLLDNCVTSVFTNREEGMNLLSQAEAAYKRLEERSDIDDQVRERVLIGLARVAEVSCDGSEEKSSAASGAWERVVKEYPETIVKEHADTRVARLKTAESRSFYKWFHEQNPTPIDPGLTPGQPAVPELPATMSPSAPADAEATEEMPADESTASEEPIPAAETTPPAKPDSESTPAKEASGETTSPEKPVSEPTPTEDSAAETTPPEKPVTDPAPAKDPVVEPPANEAPAK